MKVPAGWMRLPLVAAVALAAWAQAYGPALLVVSKQGALAIVDPVSRKVTARVRVGEMPHEVAAPADGRLAFVSNYGADTPGKTISVIDVPAQKEIRRVDIGPLMKPHGLWFAGGELYFTAELSKIIGRYNPAADKIDWLMGTGQDKTHMIQVSAGANRIFTANIDSNTVSIFERTGTLTWEQTAIPVGKGPEGFDVTPDGKQLWVANSRDGSVSVIDLATKQPLRSFAVHTKRSNRLKFTPDGRLVLISDLDGDEVLVMEYATRKELARLKLGRSPAGILVEPGGARAYVAITGDNNVAVINLKTLELEARIQGIAAPDGMAWAGAGAGTAKP
jgi:YVTN family beta-propeller protein